MNKTLRQIYRLLDATRVSDLDKLAVRCGLSKGTLVKLKYRYTASPRWSTVEKIARLCR